MAHSYVKMIQNFVPLVSSKSPSRKGNSKILDRKGSNLEVENVCNSMLNMLRSVEEDVIFFLIKLLTRSRNVNVYHFSKINRYPDLSHPHKSCIIHKLEMRLRVNILSLVPTLNKPSHSILLQQMTKTFRH